MSRHFVPLETHFIVSPVGQSGIIETGSTNQTPDNSAKSFRKIFEIVTGDNFSNLKTVKPDVEVAD